MIKAKKSIGLTYQAGKGFKKCCGWYQHEDGRRLPKIHWLGHDLEHAQFLAFTLQKAWLVIDAEGRGWTPQDIANVRAFVAEGTDLMRDALKGVDEQQRQLNERRAQILEASFVSPAASKPEAARKTAEPEEKAATLYGAIQAYLDTMNGKQRSQSHKRRMSQVLNVSLKNARPDCPLDQIDFIWLDQLCDYFKARPASRKEKGKVLSATTVTVILRYLRAFFVWIDDTGYGGWEGPRKLTKPFRVRQDDLMTSVEKRAATVIKQFDVPTLVKLYRAANDFQRSIMLTALFCGLTQQELAVLTKDEFDLDNNTLHHFRNKTGVEGKFWLPDELVKLLRKQMRCAKKTDLVFRNSDGNPLIAYDGNRMTSDTVRQFWDDLRVTAEVPDALTFKYLRKFLADYCTRHGGEEVGRVAMAHASQSVLGRNYTDARPFEKFNKLQKQLHRELKAAGMFEPVKKAKRAAA